MHSEILNQDIRSFATDFPFKKELEGEKILITGATGLLGSVMVRCLLELKRYCNLGIQLICPVRNIEKARCLFEEDFSEIYFKELTLEQISSQTIPDVDYIFHFAAPTASRYFVEHPTETFRTIVRGTDALLHYAESIAIKGFVYVSSLEVYGSILDDNVMVMEDCQGYLDPLNVRSSYPMAKRAAECLCHCESKEKNLPVYIARLTQTFGAGISAEDNRVFAQFARAAITGNDIILRTEGKPARPYCYTIDALRALMYILFKGEPGKAYNVANEQTYISAREMADFIQKEFAPDLKVKVELDNNYGYPPVTKLRLDCSELRKLGWYPQLGLKDMFVRLIDFLKEQRNL